ncbi:MAG TPA: DUF3037 domain-containing protein [Arachidicoccus sp.]|nr:DUF3037 domain-containing protein [Arachidicoccus sp.]
MQELLLYEYAIIRIVPRVEREEFINAGVIVFCKSTSYLACRIHLNVERLKCICPEDDVDLIDIQAHLNSFEAIASGLKTDNHISTLEPASRFRWLTAVRSTVIQCSRIHPGRSYLPEAELKVIFNRMVR